MREDSLDLLWRKLSLTEKDTVPSRLRIKEGGDYTQERIAFSPARGNINLIQDYVVIFEMKGARWKKNT